MMACEHLVALGHRQIAFINLTSSLRDQDYGPAVRTRWGYEQACARFQLPIIYCMRSPRSMRCATRRAQCWTIILSLTALMTMHCGSLVGIMRAAQRRGLSVPDDLSVMGILTDQIAELSRRRSRLISFPARAMGARAMQMLIRKLQDETYKDRHVTLKPPLVARDSTGPARHR